MSCGGERRTQWQLHNRGVRRHATGDKLSIEAKDELMTLSLPKRYQETVEVYEFGDYRKHNFSPSARPTIESPYQDSPNKPPGASYIKLKPSELKTMRRRKWIKLHEIHAEVLDQLWRPHARTLQTIPRADNIPFTVLYGSIFNENDGNTMSPRRPRRPTQERLTEVVVNLNRRPPSSMPIIERKCIQRCGGEDSPPMELAFAGV
ncbi:hypothetical protein F4824DRAFT_499293 [Ustulina deusta]|nr:hypothetical protein F4824DRAFT_499293 [Ustulina deusta]